MYKYIAQSKIHAFCTLPQTAAHHQWLHGITKWQCATTATISPLAAVSQNGTLSIIAGHVRRSIFICHLQKSSSSQNQITSSILIRSLSVASLLRTGACCITYWTSHCHDRSILCKYNVQNAIWPQNLSHWYIMMRQTGLASLRIAMKWGTIWRGHTNFIAWATKQVSWCSTGGKVSELDIGFTRLVSPGLASWPSLVIHQTQQWQYY